MPKIKDNTGKRFERLVVVSFKERKKFHSYWNCICDCGKEVIVNNNNLSSGHTKSCGCFQKESTRKRFLTHGFTSGGKKRFWVIYHSVRQRTGDPGCNGFKKYGKKGIKCLWNSFEDFRDDMYEGYVAHVKKYGEKQTTIDRIDNRGNYCKENCRWATLKEQQRNTSANRLLTLDNQTYSIAEWAEKTGIKAGTLHQRLRYGWETKDILTRPIRK